MVRYISITLDLKPWEHDYSKPPTLEPINQTIDPYVRNGNLVHDRKTNRMEAFDNLSSYEREEFHMNKLYGKGLYEDEMNLRSMGYTGKVSPLERRHNTNNRYR